MDSKSGSFIHWLETRYSYDVRARSKKVQQKAIDFFFGKNHLKILDIGSGIGANTKYLAPHLSVNQEWTLLEIDNRLIETALHELSRWSAQKGWNVITAPNQRIIKRKHGEILVRMKNRSFYDLVSPDRIRQYDLVTANAFFDLIPSQSFTKFATALFLAAKPLLSSLNYISIHLDPEDKTDNKYISLYESHMMRKSKFGSPMGPRCRGQMIKILTRLGFQVFFDESIWKIPARDKIMMDFMFDFFNQAISEMVSDTQKLEGFNLWKKNKLDLLKEKRLTMTVKHVDYFAQPKVNLC